MQSLNRREFLTMLAGGTLAVTTPFAGCKRKPDKGKKAPHRPNIIYILADDLGYGDLGCYGQRKIKTPYIDRLAAEGMRFTQHYAGSTVCAPSRCSLMTGLHTGHAVVRGNKQVKPSGQFPIPDETITVAEILKKAGYTTAIVGKWGLGVAATQGAPNKQGFDYFFGYLDQVRAHNYYPAWLWRNDQKIKLRNEVVLATQGYARAVGSVSTNRLDYSHDMFTAEALSFIERNKNRPFFLYLAYTIPHANNQAYLLNRHGMEVPDYGIYKDKDWPQPQKGYAAMITRMDTDIGRLMARLKKLGIDKNTLVIFSSDNGPHKEGGIDPLFFNSAGRLRGIKRDLYEGGIRVPMIARWPGKIKSGSESDLISAFWDFLPTCAELAGLDIPQNIDGISMVPTLLGQPRKQKKHKLLYWEYHRRRNLSQALRAGDFKGLRLALGEPLELYNLAHDIEERHNIAARHPRLIAEFEAYLETARTDSPLWPVDTNTNK